MIQNENYYRKKFQVKINLKTNYNMILKTHIYLID